MSLSEALDYRSSSRRRSDVERTKGLEIGMLQKQINKSIAKSGKQDRIGDNEEVAEGCYDEVSVDAFKMAGRWCRSE